MKEFQKGILDNDRVITAENVQRMGEVIALCATTISKIDIQEIISYIQENQNAELSLEIIAENLIRHQNTFLS